jgi:hydroxymethylpyrimidine pyrophosphatase-like HAD family hydrolase
MKRIVAANRPLSLNFDINGTIDDAGLPALRRNIAQRRARRSVPILAGTVTGNTFEAHKEMEEDLEFKLAVDYFQFIISAVGSRIDVRRKEYDGEKQKNRDLRFEQLESWPKTQGWNRPKIEGELLRASALGILGLQEPIAQTAHKLSFYAETPLDYTQYSAQVSKYLAQVGVVAHVIFSGGKYLDLLPIQANGTPVNKGSAILHCADYFATRDEIDTDLLCPFAAGDSPNDVSAFEAVASRDGYIIVPGNAHPDFRDEMKTTFGDNLYVAHQHGAYGVAEGLHHYLDPLES